MERFAVGVDVGGTKTAIALVDESRAVLGEKTFPSDPELESREFFDRIAEAIKELLAERPVSGKTGIAGVGIGMPSFILHDEGYIIKTSNLVKIKEFPAREYLSKGLGLPVILENDARCAALAEHRRGAGRGFANMMYCPVSSGIASAMIINGRLFRGSYGWAGETGHMIATPGEGIECGCGNRGCYMSWCSGVMIIKHIQNWIAAGEKTIMAELAGGAGKIDSIVLEKAYDSGDPMAVKAFNQMTRWLGLWFYNLYVSLNINCFVLGGGLVKMGEKLLNPVSSVFKTYNHDTRPVYFKTASCKINCGILGAAELVLGDQEAERC